MKNQKLGMKKKHGLLLLKSDIPQNPHFFFGDNRMMTAPAQAYPKEG